MVAQSLLQGVLLGLGAAVPIGPVNVEIARRTLRSGFHAGFVLGCGAVTVDITYALLSSLSLARLLVRPMVQTVLGTGGIALLLYLTSMCFISMVRSVRAAGTPLDEPIAPSVRSGYVTGFFMTLLNPLTLAFWFLVVPAAAGRVGDGSGSVLAMVCGGVFLGTISWVVCFAGLLAWLGRFRRNWWIVAADATGGIILLGFALATGWAMLYGRP